MTSSGGFVKWTMFPLYVIFVDSERKKKRSNYIFRNRKFRFGFWSKSDLYRIWRVCNHHVRAREGTRIREYDSIDVCFVHFVIRYLFNNCSFLKQIGSSIMWGHFPIFFSYRLSDEWKNFSAVWLISNEAKLSRQWWYRSRVQYTMEIEHVLNAIRTPFERSIRTHGRKERILFCSTIDRIAEFASNEIVHVTTDAWYVKRNILKSPIDKDCLECKRNRKGSLDASSRVNGINFRV